MKSATPIILFRLQIGTVGQASSLLASVSAF